MGSDQQVAHRRGQQRDVHLQHPQVRGDHREQRAAGGISAPPSAVLPAAARACPGPRGQFAVTATSTQAPYLPLNGLVRPWPAEQTTLDLIDRQVALQPGEIAVSYGDPQLSYADLDRRANQLAAVLLDHGARPDRLLPLLITDGLELPLAILAAMKAGIPFVPMDP